jgi:DNA repair ATPase RecN
MLGLDPFTSLDPAVREIAQTRELAERAIYYMQRTPGLLDMQVEKLTYALAVMPETKSLIASADRASLVGSAADRLSSELPDILANERQALIAQLMQELDKHRESVSSMSQELRSTLEAGTQTANALHQTLETLDRITARYPPREPKAGEASAARPFDIRDYTEMVRELSVTTRDLNTLAASLDSTLPAVHAATQDAAGALQQVMNRFFWQLLALIAAAVVIITLAALGYRAVVTRMQRRTQ